MSKPFAVELNIPALVAKGAVLDGVLPLAQFKRLGQYLVQTASGGLTVELAFSPSDDPAMGRIKGRLAGSIALECFRCGQMLAHPLAGEFEFAPVASEAIAAQLDEQCEPVLVDPSGIIRSVDLLEDELILQLPTAPRHAEQCIDEALLVPGGTESTAPPAPRADNPFAALKQNVNLKKH